MKDMARIANNTDNKLSIVGYITMLIAISIAVVFTTPTTAKAESYIATMAWGDTGEIPFQLDLIGPEDVAVDSENNVYIADLTQIVKLEPTGKGEYRYVTSWECDPGNGSWDSYYCTSIAYDSKYERVYTLGESYSDGSRESRVVRYKASDESDGFEFDKTWTGSETDAGDLSSASGIDVDSRGYVYIADTYSSYDGGTGRIVKFSSSGAYIHSWSKWFNDDSSTDQLYKPTGVAIDEDSNIYVTDEGYASSSTDGRVIKVKFDGGVYRQVDSWINYKYNDPSSTELSWAQDIDVDRNKSVYVADTYNNTVAVFKPKGATGESGYEIDETLSGGNDGSFSYPYGIAVDSELNVVVADAQSDPNDPQSESGDPRIVRYGLGETGHSYDSSWYGYNLDAQSDRLERAKAVATDSKGYVYAVDDASNLDEDRVIRYKQNIDGTYSIDEIFYGSDSSAGAFSKSGSISVDSSDNFYVVDYGNSRIVKYSSDGELLAVIDVLGLSGSSRPVDLSVGINGYLYVVDEEKDLVDIFTPANDTETEYAFSGSWDGSSEGFGGLSKPTSIDMDSKGNYYTVDADKNRIAVFNSNREYVTSWNITQVLNYYNDDYKFNGISVDTEGNVFVATIGPNGYGAVIKFTSRGAYVTTIDSGSTSIGGMDPTDVTLGPEGELIASDSDRLIAFERDSDSDGTVDSEDNCPDQYNSDQEDSDANGAGDLCDEGTAEEGPTTGTTTPTPPPGESTSGHGTTKTRDTTAPKVTGFKVTKKRMRKSYLRKKKRRIKFKYKLSEAARVKVVLKRRYRSKGCKKGKKSCKKKTKWRTVAKRSAKGRNGKNTIKVRVKKKRLKRGTYIAYLTASDSSGNRSKKKKTKFKVVR